VYTPVSYTRQVRVEARAIFSLAPVWGRALLSPLTPAGARPQPNQKPPPSARSYTFRAATVQGKSCTSGLYKGSAVHIEASTFQYVPTRSHPSKMDAYILLGGCAGTRNYCFKDTGSSLVIHATVSTKLPSTTLAEPARAYFFSGRPLGQTLGRGTHPTRVKVQRIGIT